MFFDVGANVGRWAAEAARLGPAHRIHAFEPHPEACAELAETFGHLDNVSCHNQALGSARGTAQLHIHPRKSSLSSLHDRRLGASDLALDQTVEVDVSTIDAFCVEHGIESVDLVKIDVEGHELEVVRGAQESLQAGRLRAVQFEYGGTYLDAGVRLHEVLGLFPDSYEVFRLVPWGLMPVEPKDLRSETFLLSNYAALLRP